MSIDQDKFQALADQVVRDVGATFAAGSILIGDRLGLYRALDAAGRPLLPGELAERTATNARYVEEWLAGQAAGGYVSYDPAGGTYTLTEEQAFAFTNPEGPGYLLGAFQVAFGALHAVPRLTEAFQTGKGIGWHEHAWDVFEGCERNFRPAYLVHLVPHWIPALDGVAAKLEAGGARVADVGCGHGASTILLAEAFPHATFTGSDYHEQSVRQAANRAAARGLDGRVSFEVASAQTFGGGPYDLIATLDCLHDMGDPLGAAQQIRRQLNEDGTWLIVEPYAGEDVADNLNPIGRLRYSASVFLCVPNALSQTGGYALGSSAGEAPIRQLTAEAGFTRFRRIAETPFNLVYEARP